MHKRFLLHGLALVATLAAATAQIPDFDPNPVPGKRAGTESWIVHFKNRNFDLSKFRAAVYARRPAAEVEDILEEIRAKMIKDQAGFVEAIGETYDAVVTDQFWLINACVIEVAPKHLAAIRRMPRVQFLQANHKTYPLIKKATSIKNHNSDLVNTVLKVTGKGVAVGIMDTGQDEKMGSLSRPHQTYLKLGDVKDTSGTGIGGSRLILNKKFGAAVPDDVHNHGTGVAGIAAGAKWNHSLADHGHAYDANIAGYSIANSASGSSSLAIMAKAWQAMAADRVKNNIVSSNLSYTGSPTLTSTEQQAMDSAAFNADIMNCVAAGNFGASTSRSQSNANGLAAAAIIADTHKMASFSSYGPLSGSGGRFYPDISSCGVSTVMPRRNSETGNYVASGTSMASPQICGAAALVRSANTKLTALETKSILLVSTQSIATDNAGKTRNNYGMGMLRDDLAVILAMSGKNFGSATLTPTSKTWKTPLTVSKGKQYAVCISWHRTQFTKTTYSDLNFKILDGTTVVAEAKSAKNLYEMVRFLSGKTGGLVLEVTGTSLDASSVKFSWAFAETPPEPVAGVVTSYGKGCLGKGFPPGTVCQSENRTQTTLTNGIASDPGGRYLIEVTAKQDMLVEGFEIYTKASALSGTPSPQIIQTQLYSANASGAPNKVIATSSMKIDTALAHYRTTFGVNFNMKKGTTFFLSVEVPTSGSKTLLLPIATSGTTTPWWVFTVQNKWLRHNVTSWNYGVICKITKAGAVPLLSARNAPALGKSVTVDMFHGLPNSTALVFTGLSDKNWIGITLPFDLTNMGGAGCFVLTGLDYVTTHNLSNAGGFTATYDVPNKKILLGEAYYHQAMVVDAGANLFGAAMSNGLRMQVGDF